MMDGQLGGGGGGIFCIAETLLCRRSFGLYIGLYIGRTMRKLLDLSEPQFIISNMITVVTTNNNSLGLLQRSKMDDKVVFSHL